MTARVNERPERRPGMPSILRRPSPRDALSDTRLGPTPALWLCHHGTGYRRLCCALSLLRASRCLGPRPRAPLPREARFSEPRRRPPTSATEFDARTHPTSRRSSHASEAFASLTASTSDAGCVGLPGALPHREPASRNLPTPGFTVAFHLRGRRRSRAGALEERRTRALDDSACPSSRSPGHPGHRLDSPPGLDDQVAPLAGQDSSWMPPRER